MAAAQGHKDVLVRAMQASSNEKAEIRSGYQRDIAVLEDKLSLMAQQLQAMSERLSEGAASEAMVEPLRQRVTQLEHELEDSNAMPGDRCNCETTTRSAPLMTNVPCGVMSGISPM